MPGTVPFDVDVLEDPLAFMRAHPQMFLAEVSGEELALQLVRGTLPQTRGPVTITRLDAWWLVAAETDWLGDGAGAAGDVFQRLLPFPEAGASSVHTEVLRTAFAAAVATWRPGGGTVLKDKVPDSHEIWRVAAAHPLWQRLVAFRMDEAKGTPA